jgi:hypothetical protein
VSAEGKATEEEEEEERMSTRTKKAGTKRKKSSSDAKHAEEPTKKKPIKREVEEEGEGEEGGGEKQRQQKKETEKRTFATTGEWLESERWKRAELGQLELLDSPGTELWLLKAPLRFDPTALLGKELTIEDFTALRADRVGSGFTLEAADGKKYSVHAADPSEYKPLIDLIPLGTEERLVLGKPFELGFNITQVVERHRLDAVPIRPRQTVPQPSNLRLRFLPPGYVMSKKERQQEKARRTELDAAVENAKHATHPLRPVPVVKKAGQLPPGDDDDGGGGVSDHSRPSSEF